jgi:adenylyltransferase/sulfurtransferase
MSFSKEELARYNRHIIIPEFGIEGQQKLKEAKVLVVGSGGLGSPLLLYLAAAGVGTIGIVDFDVVDDSNLQRQVLFGKADIGKSKAEAARDRVLDLNPHINVNVYNKPFTSSNALEILKDYDVVADGTDNFPTRYLVNDAAVLLGKVNVYASIFRFDGQVSVFNYTKEDGTKGPNYRDLYPTPPPPGLVPSCAEGGVLGVLPGIVGSLQANEVIKVITGIGEPLVGRIHHFDALNFESKTFKIFKDDNAPAITELIDYEHFCGMPVIESSEELAENEISVEQLKAKIDAGEDFQLIDVREEHEFEIANIGGALIPLGQLLYQTEEIAEDKPKYIICKTGERSRDALEMLEDEGFDQLYNVKGGIHAYADQIDTSLVKY